MIRTIYEMSKEPGWWELSSFWRSLEEETRNLWIGRSDYSDITAFQLTDDAWYEVVRRMEQSERSS